MSKTRKIIPARDRGEKELIELLKKGQDTFGCLSREFLVETAESLGLPLSEVYGVATFYSFLSIKPQGKNVIRICKCVPCLIEDADTIVEAIGIKLGIKPGETTPDGKFSLELTNCIGACDKAPAMMINYDVHGDLTSWKISQILEVY